MNTLKELFLLDPAVAFLNHGSFGAAPRAVMEVYQTWQLHLERQPVAFFLGEMFAELERARAAVGEVVGAPADDLVFIPNATTAVNIVARVLPLGPGDEILLSDHEYGACLKTWRFIAQKTGAQLVLQPVPLPAVSADALAEALWQGVTPRTRVIFLSHITSPTALRLPVEQICVRARAAGIWTVIDGAHAPGHIPLNLAAFAPDFYTGNLHKWALAPKGAAFLYTHPAQQALIEPLVVSWGWGDDPQPDTGSRYLNYLQWVGTMDPSAYLAAPAGLAFQAAHQWEQVRADCHALVRTWLEEMQALTGQPPLYDLTSDLYGQMGTAPLPPLGDVAAFKQALYDRFRVEMPCFLWAGRPYARISVQGYNTSDDIQRALDGIQQLLAQPAQV